MPHVEGRFTPRTFDEDGMPEVQKVFAHCKICETDWQGDCHSGQPRQHIARFGVIHVHRDVLVDVPRIVRPGSHRAVEKEKRTR